MAFKILTEEQIELLTDEQKAQYAYSLELYRQREEFVRQIETFENMTLPPVQASVTPIPKMIAPEAPEITLSENQVELPQCSINYQMPDLPDSFDVDTTVSKLPTVSLEYAEVPQIKMKNVQPTTPAVFVPAVAKYNYQNPKTEKILLPSPVQTELPNVKSLQMEVPKTVSLPEPVLLPFAEVKPVNMKTPELVSMPEPIAIPSAEVKSVNMKIPELVSMPEPVAISSTEVKPIRMDLPEVNCPDIEIVHGQVPQFATLELQISAIPCLEDIPAPTADAKRIGAAMQEVQLKALPQVNTIISKQPSFEKIDSVLTSMPQVAVPAVPIAPVMKIEDTVDINLPEIPVIHDWAPTPTFRFDLPETYSIPVVSLEVPQTISDSLFRLTDWTEQMPAVASAIIHEIPTVNVKAVQMTAIDSVEVPKVVVDCTVPSKSQIDEMIKMIQEMV